MYAFEEHRFSSSFMGFIVGLYITIHPLIVFIIIQSDTFAAENYSEIKKKWEVLCRMNVAMWVLLI